LKAYMVGPARSQEETIYAAVEAVLEQQEWPTDAECRADAPGGPLAQRTPATASAPQSTDGDVVENIVSEMIAAYRKNECGRLSLVRERMTAALAEARRGLYSAGEIEKAMRDTPELGNPARNYKDVDRLIKRVLARLSAREQPSKEQPVI
jgi:hypothetical protein